MASYQEAFHQLDQCLIERMQFFRNPAMVMALTSRERLERLSAHGFACLESEAPVQADHLFSIGSIGKSFTGIAVLQAHEAGLLDLHAPVSAFLPWFEVQSPYEPITIHHLLTHSSGLPSGTDVSPDPRSEVYEARHLAVGFAPGSHFCYSDLGYKILGLVLEAVRGKPYGEIIREGILAPLEMTSSFAEMTHALRLRMAQGYRDLYDDRPSHSCHPLVPAAWVETNSGDGSIISTAEDMAKFARMLLNEGKGPHGRLISTESYQKMVRPMIEEEGEAYSYGLNLFEDDGYRHAGHGGDIPGYESYLWLDLDNGLGTILLMIRPYTPRASFLALEFFRAASLGQPLPDLPPLPDFTHIADPLPFVGTYQGQGRTLVFEAEEHQLILVDGDQRVKLEKRGEDCFYANHPDWDLFYLRFGRESGQVVELTYGPLWMTNPQYNGPRDFEQPAEWTAYVGHYRSHNPWETNLRVFARKGQLILAWPVGDEEVLSPLGEGCFRIGEEEYIPERLSFDQIADGKALRAVRSGCPYYRFFTP